MADNSTSFTVRPMGSRITVSLNVTAYTDATLSTPVTFPVYTETDVTYWVPNPTMVTVSAKLPDGTEVGGQTQNVMQGVTNVFTNILPTGSTTAALSRFAYLDLGRYSPGNYYFCFGQVGPTTSAALADQTLRVSAWPVPNTLTINKIGAEITAIGAVGSKLRLGIYTDSGDGRPANLILDAGQIAGDVVGSQELTINLTLAPGLYWVGGCLQSSSGGQPTVRVPGNSYTPNFSLPSATIPTNGATAFGYSQNGAVAAGLPATFGAMSYAGTCPRVFVRVAS